MDNLVGQLFGDYRVLKLINTGGMGSVYMACHKDDSEIIAAIKVIKPEFA